MVLVLTKPLTGNPVTTALCHCLDCRKWTGAAFTSNVVVARNSFRVIEGTPKSFEIVAASGKLNTKWVCFINGVKVGHGTFCLQNPKFCPSCGSSLWSDLEIEPDLTFIKSGGLDNGAADHNIAAELYVKNRLSYAQPVPGADQKSEL